MAMVMALLWRCYGVVMWWLDVTKYGAVIKNDA